jgi:hypothetical protein
VNIHGMYVQPTTLRAPEDSSGLLSEVWMQGMMDAATAKSPDAVENPHPAGTAEHALYALAWAASWQDMEFEASNAGKVEALIEDQPGWERREASGVNGLAKRIGRRAEMLADCYSISHMVGVVLLGHRQMLADSVCELLRLAHPTGEAKAFEPLWGEWDDPDANELLRMGREYPDGSPGRDRFIRMAYRLAHAPVLKSKEIER